MIDLDERCFRWVDGGEELPGDLREVQARAVAAWKRGSSVDEIAAALGILPVHATALLNDSVSRAEDQAAALDEMMSEREWCRRLRRSWDSDRPHVEWLVHEGSAKSYAPPPDVEIELSLLLDRPGETADERLEGLQRRSEGRHSVRMNGSERRVDEAALMLTERGCTVREVAGHLRVDLWMALWLVHPEVAEFLYRSMDTDRRPQHESSRRFGRAVRHVADLVDAGGLEGFEDLAGDEAKAVALGLSPGDLICEPPKEKPRLSGPEPGSYSAG